MVTNRPNINDKAKVKFGDKSIVGEGEIGKVTAIWLMDGEVNYTFSLDNGYGKKPYEEGGLPIQFIQVKEGQYEKI